MGLQRWHAVALIALAACAVSAGPAVAGTTSRVEPTGPTDASSAMTHPDRDYAGSGLAERQGPGTVFIIENPPGLPGLDVRLGRS